MTEQEAIDKLNELSGADPECEHEEADGILLDLLKSQGHAEVVQAYNNARKRVRFWYA